MLTFAIAKTGMKRFLNIVFSVLLSVVILISTSGFMVYLHHCNHRNTTYTSLFFNHIQGEQHPCKTAEKNCCHTPDHNNRELPSDCERSCCKDFAIMLKFTPDSEPAQKSFTKFIKVIISDYIHNPCTTSDLAERSFKTHPLSPPEKPPTPGKEKVILYHQLKDDPSC